MVLLEYRTRGRHYAHFLLPLGSTPFPATAKPLLLPLAPTLQHRYTLVLAPASRRPFVSVSHPATTLRTAGGRAPSRPISTQPNSPTSSTFPTRPRLTPNPQQDSITVEGRHTLDLTPGQVVWHAPAPRMASIRLNLLHPLHLPNLPSPNRTLSQSRDCAPLTLPQGRWCGAPPPPAWPLAYAALHP